ncbi:MAG: hypothetical protein IJU49_08990 [Lachnospiraceae bacterium]|nr:hypothetical protein [Lachnospiraceae bacterium]
MMISEPMSGKRIALEKETAALFRDLQEAGDFESYAVANEDSFAEQSCPHCGAPIAHGASFCVSCMETLNEREEITLPERRPKKLWAILAIVFAACVLVFLGIMLFKGRTERIFLPSPIDLQALLVGSSDDSTRLLWEPESLHPAGETNHFRFFEADSAISGKPALIAYNENKNCVFFALPNLEEPDSSDAFLVLNQVFSAIYRESPEDREALRDPSIYRVVSEVDSELKAFLSESKLDMPEGAVILKSLPIQAEQYSDAPEATIYQLRSGANLGLIAVFRTEAP